MSTTDAPGTDESRQRVKRILDQNYPDRVFSVEDEIVWVSDTDADESPQPEYRYAVNHLSDHDTRHDAVGHAALVRRAYRSRSDFRTVKVWSYEVCGCESAQTRLQATRVCQACGGAV